MIYLKSFKGRVGAAWAAALLILVFSTVIIGAANVTQGSEQPISWQRSLPSSDCPGSTVGTNCHKASPVLVDFAGDGKLEIVVGTNSGHVVVYRHDGSLLWDKDVAGAYGVGKNQQRIASSPAVADIDADGQMEVVVGTGAMYDSICAIGGVIALEHNGEVKAGWPFVTSDYSAPPEGCPDKVFSTPALGDLDKDGDLEIVFGSFDMRIHALDHNGKKLPGFPIESYHYQRFGWGNLKDRIADTIFSSPALADLDGDGYLDIVIGTDEGNFDSRWQPAPPEMNGWLCPYQEISAKGYCGGSIYAIDRFGKVLPGFPKYQLEIIQSSPATIDMDGDGRSEIFVGAGSYYYNNSPDKPTYGFRVYGVDGAGRDLPGWEGGKRVGGVVYSSPAIGDVNGDGEVEVVVPAQDQMLYAYHLDGKKVAGFPMMPRMRDGRVLNSYRLGSSPVLADYTGDGKMEIFLHHASETIIVDGSGQQLTSSFRGDTRPYYLTDGSLQNTPAVGDLDGDGYPELVSQTSVLTVWELPNKSGNADWPMFKRNPARNSSFSDEVEYSPESITLVHEKGQDSSSLRQIGIRSSHGVYDWTLSTDNPAAINIPTGSGTVKGQISIAVKVHVGSDEQAGTSQLGTIFLVISQGGEVVEEARIPVKVLTFNNLEQLYLPFTP